MLSHFLMQELNCVLILSFLNCLSFFPLSVRMKMIKRNENEAFYDANHDDNDDDDNEDDKLFIHFTFFN